MKKRLFTDTLRDLRNGVVLDELSTKLNEVVEAVTRTNKEGSITLTIKVKPMAGGTSMLNIEDDINAKVPKLTVGGTVMFPTPENNLSRRDPRQPDLPNIVAVDSDVTTEPGVAAHG